MNLIAITGKARAGKDTLAKAFIEAGFRRVSFADTLKQVTALIADEPVELYYDDVAKEEFSEALGMTRRQALQKVGSEGLRSVLGDDVWVNRVLRQWRKQGQPPFVIADCRFDNEAALVRDAGGYVIRVTRPGIVGLTGEAANHASERGISDHLIDVEIENSGSVEQLHFEARRFMRALGHELGGGA